LTRWLRNHELKNKNLWDIAWLTQRGVVPAYELIRSKLADHDESESDFVERASERLELLNREKQRKDFMFEMSRFIPPDRLRQTFQQDGFWVYLINTVSEKMLEAKKQLQSTPPNPDSPHFPM
jgi:hypothetical protein